MERARADFSQWWPVAVPPALWGLQGALAWLLASLACPRAGAGAALSDASARIGIAVATGVALAVNAAALWIAHARIAPVAPELDLSEQRRRAVAWAGGFVAAAFAIGMIYGVLPALMVGVCETLR